MKTIDFENFSGFKKSALARTFRLISGARSVHFLSQYTIASLLLGRRPSKEIREKMPSPQAIVEDLRELLRLDADQMAEGVYSSKQFKRFNVGDDLKATGLAFLDLFSVKSREQKGDVVVDSRAKGLDLPKYYSQAFHYQSEGWLSEKSAEIYDYQVETLFGGGAAAMRRQALIPLMASVAGGGRVRILDLAAGTGLFAREIKDNLPDSHLTVCDLSPYYLKKARKNLSDYTGVDFVEANAESLPFPAETFDAIVCVYLFHELPQRVRSIVSEEIRRVLKPGGSLIFVDSIQKGDQPDFDASLKNFPAHYHEPYYINYIEQDLAEVFVPERWERRYSKRAFLSKIVQFKKILAMPSLEKL